MMNRVFDGSQFLLNGLHGFERGCHILLLDNFSNFISNPFNIRQVGSFVRFFVDVIVTSECIHLYLLCIVTRCLFWDIFVIYLSHVMP